MPCSMKVWPAALVLASLSGCGGRDGTVPQKACAPCASAVAATRDGVPADPGALAEACKLYVAPVAPMEAPKPPTRADRQVLLGVDITEAGKIFFDGKEVAGIPALVPVAREALAKNPELRATVRADAATPHGTVMAVVDALKQAGISRIAFGVVPAPSKP